MLDVNELTHAERRALLGVLQQRLQVMPAAGEEDCVLMSMWTLLRRAEQDEVQQGAGMRVKLSVLNMGGGNVEYEVARVSLTEAVLRGAGTQDTFTMRIDPVENAWIAASGIKYRPILWREPGGPWVEYDPVKRKLDPVPGLTEPGVTLPVVRAVYGATE